MKYSSISACLAMKDPYLHQLDVNTAFLHREVEEEIYMKQSEGYKVDEKQNHVCR